MRFASSRDGTRIGFESSGEGQPLLLVHGTLAERSRWNAVLPGLREKFTVHAMDRRGRGASGDAQPYALALEAEDIAAVIEEIGGAVDVVAHSYGALCALEAARLSPGVRRLVLYEPLIRNGEADAKPPADLRPIESMVLRGERDNALRRVFRDVFGTPDEEVERLASLPYWQERMAVVHTVPREVGASRAYRFSAGAFDAMNARTMLLLGETSGVPFRQSAELLQKGLPLAKTTVLQGQNHHAMVTAPEVFAATVARFLA